MAGSGSPLLSGVLGWAPNVFRAAGLGSSSESGLGSSSESGLQGWAPQVSLAAGLGSSSESGLQGWVRTARAWGRGVFTGWISAGEPSQLGKSRKGKKYFEREMQNNKKYQGVEEQNSGYAPDDWFQFSDARLGREPEPSESLSHHKVGPARDLVSHCWTRPVPTVPRTKGKAGGAGVASILN